MLMDHDQNRSDMNISVILCTYNRCNSLTKTLRSLAASRVPSTVEWEVVVVDNNSTDQTRDVAREACEQYPGRFHYVFEPRQGKSYALNTGIEHVRGAILAFVDDDVIVETTWLQSVVMAFRDETYLGCGGRVLAECSFTHPAWFPRDKGLAHGPIAVFDRGTEAVELYEPPFGNNMAFRRSAFERYGGFRTELGPRADIEMKNEDTEFSCRLLAAGERLRYEPAAIVYHAVPEGRLQKSYYLRWWFNKARADVRQARILPESDFDTRGMSIHAVLRLVRWSWSWLITTDASLRFTCKLKACVNLGQLVEYCGRDRSYTAVVPTPARRSPSVVACLPVRPAESPAGVQAKSVTVVMCTYNRCDTLAQALSSVAAQELPESVEWEVLVVDNNSSDNTREVVAEFVRQYPNRFRYLFEGKQGLSNARNTGIREAKGNVIAFMDDDTTVPPTWLHNLTASLHDGRWAGAGGRILPLWTTACPRWLNLNDRHAAAPLALFDPGMEAGELKESPFGANMAFRKEMFARYGYFRTDLGRRPGSLMSNEESEFGARLLAGGEPILYEPSAIVYHPVPESRLQKEYFLKWWYEKARGQIRAFGTGPNAKWHIRGVPLYSFRRLTRWTVAWLLTVEESKRFFNKINVWMHLGEISECYHQYLRQDHPNGAPFVQRTVTGQVNDAGGQELFHGQSRKIPSEHEESLGQRVPDPVDLPRVHNDARRHTQ